MKINHLLLFFGITFLSINLYAEEMDFKLSEEEIEISNIEFEKQMQKAKLISSGADIVGNGSGRIELLANYYLRQLDQTISHCLNSKTCIATKADRFVLKEIRQIVIDSRTQNKKLVFLNGEDFESIFNSKYDPDIRIAKTGFNRKHPIFFNLSELFKIETNELDRNLIAILIHELGHQTGIKSHSYLNEIASRVSFQFDQSFNRLAINYKNTNFELTTLHNRGPYDFSKIHLAINEQLFEISYLNKNITCADTNLNMVGVDLFNPHWEKMDVNEDTVILPIGYWANIYCENKETNETHTEMVSISIKLDFQIKMNTTNQNEFHLRKQSVETKAL